jgi:hypothetical protein
MSSNSGGADAPAANAARGGQQENRRGGRRDRRGNRNKNKTTRFKGKCEELKDFVYDINSNSADSFTKTTREIAEYVARTVSGAGEFRTGMIQMQMPPLHPPTFPTNPDAPDFQELVEIWREDRKVYTRRVEERRRIMTQVFPIVLGQCDPSMRARIEADGQWDNINNDCDVIRLLELIRNCEVQRQTRRDEDDTLIEAERAVMNYKQNSLSDSEYYETFKDKVATADRLGAAIGEHPTRVQERLVEVAMDENNPTEDERRTATQEAKDKYLARLFLVNSDKKRYGSLIRDIRNDFTRGQDTYPDTLTGAYDFIVNYEAPRSTRHVDEGGMAFYNQDQSDDNRGWQAGRGGEGRGRSTGRGRGGGRAGGRGRGHGRGRGSGSAQREIGGERDEHVHGQDGAREDEGGDEAQYLLDNLEETGDYYTLPSNIFEIVAMSASCINLPTLQLLLLDSCSTLCLISNPNLLDNIHEVPVVVRVRCNAGTTYTNLQGYLGDFPEPVWYSPGGIFNILSLKVVAKYYDVEYVSRTEDAFIVTGPNGVKVKFEPTAKGLYACSVRPGGSASDAWAFINLVDDIKGEYTKQEYRDAALARKVQNIMMFPNARAYSRIVDSNQLANCPVKRSDIAAAERIFGPNLGSLKGKTVYRLAADTQQMD